METSTSPAKRTGGRSAAVVHSVRLAVEELVEEKGRERVTVPMIAERAGVNPTSIYRRWGDLPTLINDIATYHLDPARPLPNSGDLRTDLTGWATELVRHYANPVNAALLRGGASAAGESESDCLRNRRSEAGMLVEQDAANLASDRDDLQRTDVESVDVERIVDHVIAPIIYRVIFAPWTLNDAYAARLVDGLFSPRY
jgi:AcrR family transcriptional regulator